MHQWAYLTHFHLIMRLGACNPVKQITNLKCFAHKKPLLEILRNFILTSIYRLDEWWSLIQTFRDRYLPNLYRIILQDPIAITSILFDRKYFFQFFIFFIVVPCILVTSKFLFTNKCTFY